MKTIRLLFIVLMTIFMGIKYSIAQNGVINVTEITTLNTELFYQTSSILDCDTIKINGDIDVANFKAGEIDYCPVNQSCGSNYGWTLTGSAEPAQSKHIITVMRSENGTLIDNLINSKGQYYRYIHMANFTSGIQVRFMCSP